MDNLIDTNVRNKGNLFDFNATIGFTQRKDLS